MLKRREIVYVFAENFWVGVRHLGNNCLEESMRTTQNTLGGWSRLFTVKYLLSRKETAFWLNISVDAEVVSVERSCLFCAAHVTYQIWVLFTTTECCQPANQRPDSAQFDQSEGRILTYPELWHNGQAQQKLTHICLGSDCLGSLNEWFTRHYCVELILSQNVSARKYSSGAKHKRYLSGYLWRTCSQ